MRPAILVISLAALVLAVGTSDWRPAASDEAKPAPALPALQEYDKELAAICDAARESIVQIETDYPAKYYDENGAEVEAGSPAIKYAAPPRKASSGFFVSDAGHIVTLTSNVEGAQRIIVRLSTSSTPYEARFAGSDLQTGVSVIKIEPKDSETFRKVTFGRSSDLRQGHVVAAAGNPFGLLKATTAFGAVSGFNRTVQIGMMQYAGLFQHTAQVYPGDSGGLVLNSKGEAVGIIFATYTAESEKKQARISDAMAVLAELQALTDPNRGGKMTDEEFVKELRARLAAMAERQKQAIMAMRFAEGGMSPFAAVASTESLRFAIPTDLVRNVIEQLVASGKVVRAVIGVRIAEIQDEMRAVVGLRKGEGLLIEQVIQDGPAAKAGIQNNDIILSVDGRPVSTLLEMKVLMGDYKPGDKMKLEVLRFSSKQRETIEITLGASE